MRARRLALWAAFVAAHAIVVWLCLTAPGLPMGDVTLVYRPWVGQALNENIVVGIDTTWVYPLLALLPMLAASAFGFDAFDLTWLVLVSALDLVAFALLTRGGTRRRAAGWWWALALLCLGPIALARVDAVTVPIAIVALLVALRRPTVAGVLLGVATWMKVWPAALVAALMISLRRRWWVFAGVGCLTLGVVGISLGLGAGRNLWSFLTEQTGRGLQVESPLAMIHLWQAALGMPGAFIYYDQSILTYQVTGTQVDLVAAVATPLMALAFVGVALIGIRAVHGGASTARVLPPLALALVAALIVFNKVGSPQFMVWLFAPVMIGLVMRGRAFRFPAVSVALLAALTQLFYPYLYGDLLSGSAVLTAVLTVRNLGYVAVLLWSTWSLWNAPRRSLQASDGRLDPGRTTCL